MEETWWRETVFKRESRRTDCWIFARITQINTNDHVAEFAWVTHWENSLCVRRVCECVCVNVCVPGTGCSGTASSRSLSEDHRPSDQSSAAPHNHPLCCSLTQIKKYIFTYDHTYPHTHIVHMHVRGQKSWYSSTSNFQTDKSNS